MPGQHNIERIGADAAMVRARKNDLRRYPAPDRDGDRLYPLASPTVTPSFVIDRKDTIYAIGSCFARNVEKALEGAGLRILSREFDLGEIGASIEDGANFFNKYSIHSVLNEFAGRWNATHSPGPTCFTGSATTAMSTPSSAWRGWISTCRRSWPFVTAISTRWRPSGMPMW